MIVALIDADILCYTASHAGRQEIDWGDGEVMEYENEERAKEAADGTLEKWLRAAEADEYKLVFSDRSRSQATFRYLLHPHYKGQRSDEKPPLHDYVYDYLHSQPNVLWRPGLEGDDVLGLLITKPGNDYVAVTIDKDLMTIPGLNCNPTKPKGRRFTNVSEYEADYNWMMQTLCGDTVDNYKGAPGIGAKGAEVLLEGCWDLAAMWHAVLTGYNKQFGSDRWYPNFLNKTAFDEALMNARMARILRYGDYDPDNDKVRLWHPEGEYEWLEV